MENDDAKTTIIRYVPVTRATTRVPYAFQTVRGQCGHNVMWFLKRNILYIRIAGTSSASMKDYTDHWGDLRDQIHHVVIKPGITRIGKYAFAGCKNLRSVTLPDTLRIIGAHAFDGCSKLIRCDIPDSVTGGIGKYAFREVYHITCSGLPDRERVLCPDSDCP